MTKKLVLIGAGGHAKSCVGVIESNKDYSILGFIDTKLGKGELVLGYPVLGNNDVIVELSMRDDINFLIVVGQVRSPQVRMQLYELLEGIHASIAPKVVAQTAFVSPHASIGKGTIIMHHAVVNTGARIGNNVIVNNLALVEHDCVVGDHTHISTGALINGDCKVGDRVFVGSGAVLVHGTSVGSDVLIGAGAVVTSSITEPGTYVGNPAKKIK